MLSFKEYILVEKAVISNAGRYGVSTPISVNARNINVAKVELSKSISKDVSMVNEMDLIDQLKELRGLYDIRTNNIYLMFSMDGIHELIMSEFNIRDSNAIHLTIFETRLAIGGYSASPIHRLNQYDTKDKNRWKKDIKKYVGTRYEWKGPFGWE